MTPFIKAKIEAAADFYRDKDFESNPNGYSVSTWSNRETTSEAFLAGAEAFEKLLLEGEADTFDDDEALFEAAEEYDSKQYGMADHAAAFQSGAVWQHEQSRAVIVAFKLRLAYLKEANLERAEENNSLRAELAEALERQQECLIAGGELAEGGGE